MSQVGVVGSGTEEGATLDVQDFAERSAAIRAEIGKVIVGQDDLVRQVLVCLLANAHALLEGVPGLGKTMLVRTIADVIDCSFARIQFTPDLMPADIIGTNVLVDEAGSRTFRFQPGPVFANLVLADEINRATPRNPVRVARGDAGAPGLGRAPASQARAAVLRAGHAEPARDGGDVPAPGSAARPVPVQALGALPVRGRPGRHHRAHDRDRPPDRGQGRHCRRGGGDAATRAVGADRAHVTAYAVSLLAATHPDNARAPELVKRYVRYGGSPRGAQALVLAGKINALMDGRFNVATDDIRAVAMPALRHRVIRDFEGEAEGITPDALVRSVLDAVTPPTVD